jgi:GTP-binding protein
MEITVTTGRVKDASFLRGAPTLEFLPDPTLPEVAVVGRSNVGKSTFINRITSRRSLARTSSTPGRTQELNFFNVRYEVEDSDDRNLFLVDLPGFGFAKLSKGRREELAKITVDYLSSRPSLHVVCLLNDCRRDPGSDEFAIRNIAGESGAFLVVVVTKIDKLTRSEQKSRLSEIGACYGLEPGDLIPTGEGVAPFLFWQRIESILNAS